MKNMMDSEKGFTLIELMIVIAIVGILAGIAIPNFLNLKDRAIFGTGKANVDILHSALASYAANSQNGNYPVGNLNFAEIRNIVPKANLPPTEVDAKWQTGSFSYFSSGESFAINVNSNNRAFDSLFGSPSGITPAAYPH